MMANLNHPAAGTYHPAVPGAATLATSRTLALQGQTISAVVDADGLYALFAGTVLIGHGQLDGTEGPLMVFFAAEATRWSVAIDEVMAEEAAVRAYREAAHRAEADAAPAVAAQQTLEEIITMVDALGGKYQVSQRAGRGSYIIRHQALVRALRGLDEFGINVEVKTRAGGPGWYLEVTSDRGKVLGQYDFWGH